MSLQTLLTRTARRPARQSAPWRVADEPPPRPTGKSPTTPADLSIGIAARTGEPVELAPDHRGLLVVGGAGCGKTVLIKKLSHRLVVSGSGRALAISNGFQGYRPLALHAGGSYAGPDGSFSPAPSDDEARHRVPYVAVGLPKPDSVGFWRQIVEGIDGRGEDAYRLFFDGLDGWLTDRTAAETIAEIWEDPDRPYPVGTVLDPTLLLTPTGRRLASSAGAVLVMRQHRARLDQTARAFGPFARAALGAHDLEQHVAYLRRGEGLLFAAGHGPTRVRVDVTEEELRLFNTDPSLEASAG